MVTSEKLFKVENRDIKWKLTVKCKMIKRVEIFFNFSATRDLIPLLQLREELVFIWSKVFFCISASSHKNTHALVHSDQYDPWTQRKSDLACTDLTEHNLQKYSKEAISDY